MCLDDLDEEKVDSEIFVVQDLQAGAVLRIISGSAQPQIIVHLNWVTYLWIFMFYNGRKKSPKFCGHVTRR